ncbi:MAG: TonB-dependent receptor [Prevotellaceae bacterium]|jgi:iron complex outermembrane receptor protein|nr:TonB-dependent receptor [Prevotellaceae bacterium]
MKSIFITIILSSIAVHALAAQNRTDTLVPLNEVVVEANSRRSAQMQSPQNTVRVGKTFLEQHFAGSLMQTLENIPGIKAMGIGSGQSKPTIRGLGFNRMLVAENGVKHEAQQWGDDHGLEIDRFALDNVEIVKGAGTLHYGSDAVAGVINLNTSHLPQQPLEGEITLFGQTNNESTGLAARIGGRKNGFWYRANFTLIDYADYKIPADSIRYYSYYIKIKNNRLRNTAGKEQSGGLHFGYFSGKFLANFHVSDVYAGSGFFANAHGLEVRLSDLDYDKSRRDIDLPAHTVNHFKVINRTSYTFDNIKVTGNFAFQNNFRQEFAEPVSHGYMPIPPGSLERQYNKNTLTANIEAQATLAERHKISASVDFESQHNRRGGWGFVIPDFRSASSGIFVYDKFEVCHNLHISGGVRFDRISTKIDGYRDWYKTPDGAGGEEYRIRSAAAERRFNAVTYALGVNCDAGNWNFKSNFGKSFRAPIPKELGSDGVNYHIFRYEKGNIDLSPEESYQWDAGISFANRKWVFLMEPFVNFFPNYIYLNPTSGYYEGLQKYYYTQSRVFRWGFEYNINYKITDRVEFNLSGDYLFARQLSGDKKGYTLPFSPPAGACVEIKYTPNRKWQDKDGYVSLNVKLVDAQNDIVPPENPTAGYALLNAAAGRLFDFEKTTLKIGIQANNLLNRRYYNHTSFYRLIDVPEAGRNFSIILCLTL